jgi:hypothetical protein
MLARLVLVVLAALPLLVFLACPAALGAAPEIGSSAVLRWKDGRQTAMAVTLDDQLESQRKFAVPELEKRHLKATFLLNPGNERFTTSEKVFWQEELPKLGHEYGVHTMQHRATNETVDADLAQCVAILSKVNPNSSPLMSFAVPGGNDANGKPVFNVSKEKAAAALAKNHLISRDTHLHMYLAGQTVDDLKKWVDQVIARGDFEKICIHGVGGDYITMPLDVFTGYLDYLVARQDVLWVARHIDVAKYAEEFRSAKAAGRVVGEGIEVVLTSAADPALYDEPLTVETRVPTDWASCRVVQGKVEATVVVKDGIARYEARPGGGTVVLTAAAAGRAEPR